MTRPRKAAEAPETTRELIAIMRWLRELDQRVSALEAEAKEAGESPWSEGDVRGLLGEEEGDR